MLHQHYSYSNTTMFFFSYPANSGNLLHIQCVDSSDANLAAKFELACKFLGRYLTWVLLYMCATLTILCNHLKHRCSFGTHNQAGRRTCRSIFVWNITLCSMDGCSNMMTSMRKHPRSRPKVKVTIQSQT